MNPSFSSYRYYSSCYHHSNISSKSVSYNVIKLKESYIEYKLIGLDKK